MSLRHTLGSKWSKATCEGIYSNILPLGRKTIYSYIHKPENYIGQLQVYVNYHNSIIAPKQKDTATRVAFDTGPPSIILIAPI